MADWMQVDPHIHTALSPCADEEMTPWSIVRMAQLEGLKVIAVTDHNTIANAWAVIEVGKVGTYSPAGDGSPDPRRGPPLGHLSNTGAGFSLSRSDLEPPSR